MQAKLKGMSKPDFVAALLASASCLVATTRAQETPDAGPAPRVSIQGVTASSQLSTTARLLRSRTQSPTGQRPRIMLTGYWPPTNEMVRRFSISKKQNPSGWVGSNWENRGYDIYSFFPEFPTGTWPKGVGDFEVDYQDTTSDFARITPALAPRAIVTCSRGGSSRNWEVEMVQRNFSRWVADSLAPRFPTPSPPDSSIPADHYRRGTLPARAIVSALNAARVNVRPNIDWRFTGGSYLSGFIAYHGMWWQALNYDPSSPTWCAAAAHIHVAGSLPVADATTALHVTLRALIAHLDNLAAGRCQQEIGFGGLDPSHLSVCGQPLKAGGRADLEIVGLPPNSPAFLLLGLQAKPSPFASRMVLPSQIATIVTLTSNASGNVKVPGIPGGAGPFTIYGQAVSLRPTLPGGLGFSNGLAIRFLR